MRLIEEIEISYFRSFYKFRVHNLKDLNIIFGKNDSGKSNLVRALHLFFEGSPDHTQPFEFPVDFCERRRAESDVSDAIRKFLYVKVTFNTPVSYQPSLGRQFYVKRQWTVSRGQDYHEEISNKVAPNRKHIVRRLLNKIKFIYVPAIKDIRIFEMLLAGIHETVARSDGFTDAVDRFSNQLHELTREMFQELPHEVSTSTKIGAPTQLSQFFQRLDFETISDGETTPKSLTRQRGDGIKVRHIPELLNFISEKDKYDYHLWGFEEPENSLDFVASQSESKRLLDLAKKDRIQVMITTHSPSFYLLKDQAITKYYVKKDESGSSIALQGRDLEKFDPELAVGEGFYLPAVAEQLKCLASIEARAKEAEAQVEALRQEIRAIASPVVLTEGRTDAQILRTAWAKRRGGDPPFEIRTCETGGENAGSGDGGAQRLALRLKGVAVDHPHAVIGLFDYDEEGVKAYQLDTKFVEKQIAGYSIKRGMHGRSYAACLPAPDFRQECKDHRNMPIEFLFRDQHLMSEIEGQKLELKIITMKRRFGEKNVEVELDDVTHFKCIASGKSGFAEVVVPALEREAFEAFDAVFDIIESIIEHEQREGARD